LSLPVLWRAPARPAEFRLDINISELLVIKERIFPPLD
jgi:hypothetical protein